MPIRRLALDVDKVVDRPDLITLARAIENVPGVGSVNITVTEIDVATIGTDITVEGDDIDTEALFRAIERVGAVPHSVDEVSPGRHRLSPPCAVLHSVDEVVAGDRIIERVLRVR